MSAHGLTVDAVDMELLTQALGEGDRGPAWYFNVDTGDVRPGGDWSDGFDDQDLEDDGWVRVIPPGGRAGFEDMELFTAAVGDVRARDVLTSCLEGKGVFRRFREALRDFPDLKEPWRSWQVAREDARAIRWLLAGDHVDELDAETSLAVRRDKAAAALDAVRVLGGLALDVAHAPARWAEVVAALEAGGTVALTRDGRAFASITSYESTL